MDRPVSGTAAKSASLVVLDACQLPPAPARYAPFGGPQIRRCSRRELTAGPARMLPSQAAVCCGQPAAVFCCRAS